MKQAMYSEMLLETIEISWLGDESDTIIWIDRSGPFTALGRVGGLMVGVISVLETRVHSALQLSNSRQRLRRQG